MPQISAHDILDSVHQSTYLPEVLLGEPADAYALAVGTVWLPHARDQLELSFRQVKSDADGEHGELQLLSDVSHELTCCSWLQLRILK